MSVCVTELGRLKRAREKVVRPDRVCAYGTAPGPTQGCRKIDMEQEFVSVGYLSYSISQ